MVAGRLVDIAELSNNQRPLCIKGVACTPPTFLPNSPFCLSIHIYTLKLIDKTIFVGANEETICIVDATSKVVSYKRFRGGGGRSCINRTVANLSLSGSEVETETIIWQRPHVSSALIFSLVSKIVSISWNSFISGLTFDTCLTATKVIVKLHGLKCPKANCQKRENFGSFFRYPVGRLESLV